MRLFPLSERKVWLQAIIEGVETHGEALFAAIIEQDFEGIVREETRRALCGLQR